MYNTNKIHAIIFDMDGTVLESEGLFSLAEQKLLVDYGVHVNLDALSEFRGMSEDDFYPHFIDKFQISDSIENLKFKLKEHLFTKSRSKCLKLKEIAEESSFAYYECAKINAVIKGGKIIRVIEEIEVFE